MKLSVKETEDLLSEKRELTDAEINGVLTTFKPVVIKLSRRYFLFGGDNDDLIQEGMIGLYEAVRKWDSQKSPSFEAFSAMCITRHMLTAIKKAGRNKHMPLNKYVPVDILDSFEGTGNPEEFFLDKERQEEFDKKIRKLLTPYEHKVLLLYFDGQKGADIAEKLSKDLKSVENALHRVKLKLK
jgi:RNA polymerase sporulation-specific sigma factor